MAESGARTHPRVEPSADSPHDDAMAHLLRIALASAFALCLLAPTHAQVVQVRNTGCPNAAYPTHNGTARLGQAFTWSYRCTAPAGAFAVFGYPTGGGIDFNRPATCSIGP